MVLIRSREEYLSFSFTTYSNLGNSSTGNPFLFRDNQWVSNANLSWIKGKHGFRFGIEYNRAGINHFQPQGGTFQTARGSLRFFGPNGGSPTALNGGPTANQYNSWAAFLLGLPSEVGKATQLVNPIAIRWSQWAWYARDQWQIFPKLTLTVGVRWEFYPMATSDNGRGVRYLDPTSMNVLIGGASGVPIDDGVDVGSGQFLPRVGIAYRLTEKTVIRAGYGMSADPNNFRFVRNWYPSVDNSDFTGTAGLAFAPAASLTGTTSFAPYPGLTAGIPAASLPDISQGIIPLPDGRSTGTLANPLRRGYINSFNLVVQREFAGFVGEAGYVGTRGIRPLTNMNINPGPIGGGQQNGRILNAEFHHTSTDVCPTSANPTAACRGWGDINSEIPFKNNYYDSLQAKLTRRLGGGSQIGAAYTFSKAIDYSDNEELNFLLFPFPDYWQKNKGLASFDRTHNFQLYGLYELPFGRGKRFAQSGIGNALAGGWQLNWVFSHVSGTPFTISASDNAFNAAGNTETADVVGPIHISGCHRNDKSCAYFDTSAFAAPTGPRFGTGGRNIVRGPGFINLDTSVFRNFKITERFTFQFRAEAFGVTNTPHFFNPLNTSPTANVSQANFGVITRTLGVGGNEGTNLNGARTFWFAGKLIF